MTGNALVVGQGAHGELRCLARGAHVGVEHAGTAAVEGARLVVGAGRGLLGEFRHGLHLHAELGAHVEGAAEVVVHLVENGLVLLEHRRLALGRVRVLLRGVVGELLHARADAAFGKTLGNENRVHLLGDARHLGQAQLMQLVGGHVGGGVLAHAPGVVGVAVGQVPGAVIALRLGLERDEVVDEGGVRRLDLLLHGRLGSGEQARARGRVHLVRRDLVQLLLEADVEQVLLGRLGDEALHLRNHFLHGELRRDDPLALAQLELLQHLGQLGREGVEAGDVVLGLAAGGDLVHLGHEVRQRALHAEHLVDGEIVVAEAVALDLDAQEVLQRVVGQLALRVHATGVVAVQGVQLAADHVGHLLVVRGRGVVELVAVEVHPAGQDAHAREHFRAVDGELGEGARVEPVDARRLEIPDMSKKGAAQHQYQHDQAQQPLQQAFHGPFPGTKARAWGLPGGAAQRRKSRPRRQRSRTRQLHEGRRGGGRASMAPCRAVCPAGRDLPQ